MYASQMNIDSLYLFINLFIKYLFIFAINNFVLGVNKNDSSVSYGVLVATPPEQK
jgi:hypothetical protein